MTAMAAGVFTMSDLENKIRDLREKTNQNRERFLEAELRACAIAVETARLEISLGRIAKAREEFAVASRGADVAEGFLRQAPAPMAGIQAELADLRASLRSLGEELEAER